MPMRKVGSDTPTSDSASSGPHSAPRLPPAAMITVSGGLKDALLKIGAPNDKVTVLRNGVDTALFRPPADREASRAKYGFTRKTLISVGLLIERKGHHRRDCHRKVGDEPHPWGKAANVIERRRAERKIGIL